MKKRPRQSNREAIRAQMRRQGLRITPGRVAVLDQLAKSRQPVSHADLTRQLVVEGFEQSTVYRNLMDLTEAGLVKRIDLGDHVWRFELCHADSPADQRPAHFVCADCGGIIRLPTIGAKIHRLVRRSSRATIADISEILLKGYCANCA